VTVWGGGPHDRFGAIIGLGEKRLIAAREIDKRAKGAMFSVLLAQLDEKAFGGIEPRGRFRRVMEARSGDG
jgi:hypothetical protein